jgi:hypothetical protein
MYEGDARMLYALCDTETNNLVAEYGNRRDVLALVLSGIERNGPGDTDTLSLEAEDESGQVVTVAYGRDLAALAQRELSGIRLPG